MYYLITTGESGSYIVNNFVSHETIPKFSEWPNTYGFLGMILLNADLTPYEDETPESFNEMAKLTMDLCDEWSIEVLNYSTRNGKCPSNPEEIFKNFQNPNFETGHILKTVANSNLLVNFGMDLNRCSAGFLNTFLDNDQYSDDEKNCLMNNLIEIAGDFF